MLGKFLNPNRIWFTIVLLHIVASVLVYLLEFLPFSAMMATAIIWIVLAALWKNDPKIIGFCIIGWMITVYIMHSQDISSQGTILLNEILMLYVFWICRKSYVKPLEYCHLRRPSLKSICLIIIVAIFLFIMADYVNACSMLAFQNLLDDSLQEVRNNPIKALIAVAVLPAFIEETLFRGLIYQGIPNKRMTILISAVLFALLHMNFNQMCYAFVMGLAFAVVIYITDNLTVTILLHMLFNAFTVMICCFPSSNVISGILRCNIAGYSLFNPSLTDIQGVLQPKLVVVGGIIAILSALIAGYLIFLIGKAEKENIEKANTELEAGIINENLILAPNTNWKPDIRFFAGSGICILIAILYEVII